MKTLQIDEKFWGRAPYEPKSDREFKGSLNNANGKMCCLGFVGQACGVTKTRMRGESMPSDLATVDVEKVRASFPWLFNEIGQASWSATDLAVINDSRGHTIAEKRKQIRKIFKAHGVRVIFKKAA